MSHSLNGIQPNCEIIVVTYNTPELDEKCFRSIKANTEYAYILTVVDNYVEKKNLAKLWNEMINKSECDYICLLNPDTEVEEGWLTKLIETMEVGPKIRITGPSTNACGSPQSSLTYQQAYKQPKAVIVDVLLSGFCMVFHKLTWKEFNGFDESYPLYGQDTDFVARVLLKGYNTAWRVDCWVKHEGSATIKKAVERGELNYEDERRKGVEHFLSKIPFGKLKERNIVGV